MQTEYGNRSSYRPSRAWNTKLTDIQIIDAVERSMHLQHDDQSGVLTVMDGLGSADEIYRIFTLGSLINDKAGDAYHIKLDKHGQFLTAKPGLIAKKLYEMGHARTDYHMHYDTHDYITVLLEALMRYKIRSFADLDPRLIANNEDGARMVNQMVTDIRKQLRSERVSQRMRNRLKNARRNNRSANDYIESLFQRYGRLCVSRLDLGYRRLQDGGMVSLKQANADIKALLRSIKTDPVFNNCVGHIGKLEYGESKGYHFHLFFFFNGARVQRDVFKTDQIGRLWQVITKGHGLYHNCNNVKEVEYGDSCGIGIINHRDEKKRQNLIKAVRYITKSSQFLMAKLTRRSRLFFRGQSPKERMVVKGRPRQNLKQHVMH